MVLPDWFYTNFDGGVGRSSIILLKGGGQIGQGGSEEGSREAHLIVMYAHRVVSRVIKVFTLDSMV